MKKIIIAGLALLLTGSAFAENLCQKEEGGFSYSRIITIGETKYVERPRLLLGSEEVPFNTSYANELCRALFKLRNGNPSIRTQTEKGVYTRVALLNSEGVLTDIQSYYQPLILDAVTCFK